MNMKTIDDFISEESKNFADLSTPEALHLLIHNIAKNCADYFVTQALKAADENAVVTAIDHEEIWDGSWRPIYGVDSDSILKAYPLDNIK